MDELFSKERCNHGWLCGRRVEHDAEDDRLHGVAAFEADCDGAADVLGLQRDESRRARK